MMTRRIRTARPTRQLAALLALGALLLGSASAQEVLYTHNGTASQGAFGQAVSGIGDVNRDGHGDYIIATPAYNQNDGRAQVYSGIDGSMIYDYIGGRFQRLAYAVSGVGDVNQDGADDFAMTSVGVFGFPHAELFSGIDGTSIRTYQGIAVNSIARVGDVDADGVEDYAFGQPFGTGLYGQVLVFSGGDGSIIHTLVETGFGFNEFGYVVNGAGDANNDGYDDIIVGQPSTGYRPRIGEAMVFSGFDGSLLHSYAGTEVHDQYGRSVSGIGDINDDGHDDHIVGVSLTNFGFGRAEVHSGLDGSILYAYGGRPAEALGWNVDGPGDLNGDGTPDFIIAGFDYVHYYSGTNGLRMYTYKHPVQSAPILDGAGDVNNDGIADLLIADYYVNGFTGTVSVLSGNDLYLNAHPEKEYHVHEQLNLTTSLGQPGCPVALVLIGLDGAPMFQFIGLGVFDANGQWNLSYTPTTTTFESHSFTFQAFTCCIGGQIQDTAGEKFTVNFYPR